MGMKRRELLKRAGIGSAAIAAAPALGNVLATTALADDDEKGQTGFHFVCVAAASQSEVLAMQADGRFNAKEAQGGGKFVHFHGSAVISGSWRARKVRSFVDGPDFDPNGQFSSGNLKLDIQLRPIGFPRTDALLEIQCNPPSNTTNTPPEGITVTVPSLRLTFLPEEGVTIFTPRDGDRD